MAPQKTDGRESGSAVFRVLDLLQTVASSDRALTLAELCAKLDLPKPTMHRLCQRMENEGYLMREPGGRHYGVGPKLLRMGLDVVRSGISAERRAVLESLVEAIGETCNFTTLAGHEVLYLDRVEARWPLRLHLEPGSRVPLHCTASGKLFLAAMPPDRCRRLLDAIQLLEMTPRTITDRAGLEAELAAIREQGYSLDREEFLIGLIAIAVPVKDRGGRTFAAIACHAPVARLSLAQAEAHLPILKQASERLATTLPC